MRQAGGLALGCATVSVLVLAACDGGSEPDGRTVNRGTWGRPNLDGSTWGPPNVNCGTTGSSGLRKGRLPV